MVFNFETFFHWFGVVRTEHWTGNAAKDLILCSRGFFRVLMLVPLHHTLWSGFYLPWTGGLRIKITGTLGWEICPTGSIPTGRESNEANVKMGIF